MERALIRFFQRALVVGLGILTVWLIVFVFRWVDRRVPSVLALALSYAIAAYLILPRSVHLGLAILRRKRVPSYTVTGDGLPGDPVNVVLVGTLAQLRAAFAAAGWHEADQLGLKSSWRMIQAFLFNTPYPTAPFSTLYLFGRGQDIGFQKCINNSPRRRHHVRFWALSLAHEASLGRAQFWRSSDLPPAELTRTVGRRRHKGHGVLLYASHIQDHPRHRRRYEYRARLHHHRTEQHPRDRRTDCVSRRAALVRARQSLRDRWRTQHGGSRD